MADNTPADSHATSSQIPPLLRQKRLNRAATFSEGAQPPKPTNLRRSSLLSEYSDTRFTPPRPTNDDMDILTSTDEPSFWYSAPLAFAILPAVGGLLFPNGSAYVTDILLLALGALFLNWCVRSPWEWYHAAQQQQRSVDTGDEWLDSNDTVILEKDEGQDESSINQVASSGVASTGEESGEHPGQERKNMQAETDAKSIARQQLARKEIFALIACFFGPILGAYLLHVVRLSLLTRPAEGLVSNYNLTIFVLAAELRPVSHLIKLQQAQIVHLQRIAGSDTSNRLERAEAEELAGRLSAIEAHLAEPVIGGDIETSNLRATIHQSLQPQLDALNRAVRRYEKRQVAQTLQIEARFGDLETRLKDALALAAAAARTSQRPSFISMAITRAAQIISRVLHMAWAALTYPSRKVVSLFYGVRSWFAGPDRRPRKRTVQKVK